MLSVISLQIQTIHRGIKEQHKIIEFEGNDIPLDYKFGVYITMNPTYAGRTNLPDHLKAMFRPVAMMTPDFELIAEIMFMSDGKLYHLHYLLKY